MSAEPTLDVMSVLEKVREDTTAAMKAPAKKAPPRKAPAE